MKIFCLINFGDRAHCSRNTLKQIKDGLQSSGHSYIMSLSRSFEDTRQKILQARKDGFDTLLIGGGDGTIHHTINLCFDQDWTFGILPMGTTNALARSLNLPLNPVKALNEALTGATVDIDAGDVNGRIFLCFGSIGFDSIVVDRFAREPWAKYRRIGHAWHALNAFRMIGCHDPIQIKTSSLNESISAYQVIFSNISNYAGVNIFNNTMNDGLIDVYVFMRSEPLSFIRYATQLAFNPRRRELHKLFPNEVIKFTTGEMTLIVPDSLPLQLDGDPFPAELSTTYNLKVRKKSIRVLTNSQS